MEAARSRTRPQEARRHCKGSSCQEKENRWGVDQGRDVSGGHTKGYYGRKYRYAIYRAEKKSW